MANKKSASSSREYEEMIGANLSFAAAEAYKLLRTNLSFSLTNPGCKIIGVTSSLRGEGKSTTSINLAYTMAQTGQKVLLLEGDLRLPTLSRRLGLRRGPGISNLLAGQCNGGDVLQVCQKLGGIKCITAGSLPPNPAELLGSEYMATVFQVLRDSFDVIVVDLPPIAAVSDALIVAKHLDGMLLVNRQNHCDKASLEDTISKLRFADCKLLGFVVTGTDPVEKSSRYYKKYGYYRRSAYNTDTAED